MPIQTKMLSYFLFVHKSNWNFGFKKNLVQAKVFYLESERAEEAFYFDELCGAQEIADFDNLINSPNTHSPDKDDKNVQNVQGSPNVSIHTTLNPIKTLTLNVSIGESSQEDSQWATIEPVERTVQDTSGTSISHKEKEQDSITHAPLIKIKQEEI